MRKFFISVGLVIAFSNWSYADQITLNWNVSAGVTGYKIYTSIDKGATWQFLVDAPTNTAVVSVPGDKLVLIRVNAVNALGESSGNYKGAFYNGVWRTGVNGMSAD